MLAYQLGTADESPSFCVSYWEACCYECKNLRQVLVVLIIVHVKCLLMLSRIFNKIPEESKIVIIVCDRIPG